jgi:3-dehydroquinate synthase
MDSLLPLITAGRLQVGSKFDVSSKSGDYSVEVMSEPIEQLSEFDFVIIDSFFEDFRITFDAPSVRLDASEDKKTLSTVEDICYQMAAAGVTKSSKLVAIGGGVVQDVATLVSSIYKRGIDWEYLPTTLAGMMDSCMGGKSSINARGIKNIIGNTYPPKSIVIDTSFISSLGETELIDGLSEGVKITFARGDDYFNEFLDNPSATNPESGANLQDLIKGSLLAKKWFVEKDEFDKKERRLLNFGHTFGHALEGASNFSISHGVAVSLGMLAAVNFSNTAEVERVAKLSKYCKNLLEPISDQLSKACKQIDWTEFQKLIVLDKKNSAGNIHLILPDRNGNLIEKIYEKDIKTQTGLEKSMKLAIQEATS